MQRRDPRVRITFLPARAMWGGSHCLLVESAASPTAEATARNEAGP